jgi:PKD repeat protein
VIYPTSAGIWVGGDTDWIGNYKYYRGKDSFFPYAGGETLPASATASLPDNVYVGGGPSSSGGTLTMRSFDGTTAGSSSSSSTSATFADFRGAFMVDGNLIYADTDGDLHSAPFDGTTLGTSTTLDPYDDPAWDDVQTGSGQTYQGSKSPFNSEISSVTGLTYANGYLFYTLAGHSGLYYRYFEPESGIVGATEFTASSSVSFYSVEGMFVSGSTLYWANSLTGALDKAAFSPPNATSGNAVGASVTGASSVANATVDWRGRALFLAQSKGGTTGGTPKASFTATCTAGACSFNGTGSTDTGGTITGYAWTFGDGGTGSGVTVGHTYAASGTYTVALTVTDNTGATSTTQGSVSVTVGTTPPSSISFVGASGKDSSSSAPSVPVPAGTASGDLMLLFLTLNGTSTTVTGPGSSWKLVGTETATGITTSVWEKVATSSDPGTSATVSFNRTYPKSDLDLVTYRGVAAAGVRAYAARADAFTASHVTPGLATPVSGDWVVSYWADKSSTTTAWTPPSGQTVRSTAYGSGTGFIGALITDYGTSVSGPAGPLPATVNAASGKSTDWTIELAGS